MPDRSTTWPAEAYLFLLQNEKSAQSVLALQEVKVAQGSLLFREDQPCHGFPLVLQGEVSVCRSSSDGRSLELYRVTPGEVCLISAASIFRQQAMSAWGVATRDTTILLLPPEIFMQFLDIQEFRQEVMSLFVERLSDLMMLVEAVAFRKLDSRLAAALLGYGEHLHITHQSLADRLGTAREIVTRLLRRFEQEQWVKLGREEIRIINGKALRSIAEGAPWQQ